MFCIGHVQNPPVQNLTSQVWEPLTNSRVRVRGNSDSEK